MQTENHTFPLPDFEVHKLDELQQDIEHPFSRKTKAFFQEHRWPLLAGIFTGIAFALLWRERSK